MKKFLSGVLCATLVFSLALSALAISGNVSFNLSAIKFDGQVISEAGDGYTLSNGCVAPASITYTDEKGGGTTYLPVRRIGELTGVTIDWDGAVVVKTPEFVQKEKVEADRVAALDTSTWSDEKQAAYQEFKAMWKISPMEGKEYGPEPSHNGAIVEAYNAEYIGSDAEEVARAMVKEALQNGFCRRLAAEVQQHDDIIFVWFRGPLNANGKGYTATFDYFDSSLD